jgi:predicted small lipoprotein YifL
LQKREFENKQKGTSVMNKMKKVLALLLALVMAFSLCACGKKAVSEENPAAAEKTEKTEQTEKAEPAKNEAEESATDAEGDKSPAKETEKPANTEKPLTDEFIKENVSVGAVEGSGTTEADDADEFVPASPQVNTPVEGDSNDEPVTINMDIYDITYDMYLAMSAAEQQAVIALFGSTEDFMVWLNYVKAEYEAEHPAIEVGPGGVVDLG